MGGERLNLAMVDVVCGVWRGWVRFCFVVGGGGVGKVVCLSTFTYVSGTLLDRLRKTSQCNPIYPILLTDLSKLPTKKLPTTSTPHLCQPLYPLHSSHEITNPHPNEVSPISKVSKLGWFQYASCKCKADGNEPTYMTILAPTCIPKQAPAVPVGSSHYSWIYSTCMNDSSDGGGATSTRTGLYFPD